MVKLPYGVRDFDKLISEKYLYWDRTDRIPLIENAGPELLFMRPRRFGKSLLLSMLTDYYDVAKADDFDRLFGDLAIGENPTPLHNQYLVMRWDFSRVESQGDIDQMGSALHDHINGSIEKFMVHYRDRLTHSITLYDNSMRSFDSVLAAMDTVPHRLYLFIDEYDNFANEVLMGDHGDNQRRYEDFIMGEGLFKTIFKNIKSAASGSGSVNKDITWRPYFNDLCGFREDEVQPIVQQIVEQCGLPTTQANEAMELMRIFYDGSCFTMRNADNAARIYNPTSTIYFLEELQEYCSYPLEILDSNLKPDPKKLAYIADHPLGRSPRCSAISVH